MPAWRRSSVKPGMMRSSTSSSACRTQSDQSPPPQILVTCVRSTTTAVMYLELSLTQTMILVPVPSLTSQPVGCVWVKNAIQVCGVRLMPARQNTGQQGTMLFRMHAMGCVAYLAAILISALLMPTLFAASTPCFFEFVADFTLS